MRSAAAMTPSETLLAAADRIRDLAAATAPGRWTLTRREDQDGNHVHSHFTLPPLPGSTVERRARQVRPSDAADYEWIAALSPAVAPMIEQLLRSAAATCEQAAREGWTDAEMREHADADMRATFALAETILGSGVDTHG